MARVFVMLSGGVDSSVVAYILKTLGHSVVGVYMRRWWDTRFGACPAKEDMQYVRAIGKMLEIPVHMIDVRKEYEQQVIQDMLQAYKNGVTPNPDVLCNRHIKFKLFTDFAFKNGADFVASGHYARVSNVTDLTSAGFSTKKQLLQDAFLSLPLDSFKDQTYFLYDIDYQVLPKVMFPLEFLIKPVVRSLAQILDLPTANRPDSTGICFIGDLEMSKFLQHMIGTEPGDIIDIDTGQKVGKHQGLWFYTIGQRKGLGIGGVSPAYYVVKKDAKNNVLYVAKGRFNKHIFSHVIKLTNVNWLLHKDYVKFLDNKQVGLLIRYRSWPYLAKLKLIKSAGRAGKGQGEGRQGGHSGYEVALEYKDLPYIQDVREKQGFWAVAPGQSAVIYSQVFDKIDYVRVRQFYRKIGLDIDKLENITTKSARQRHKFAQEFIEHVFAKPTQQALGEFLEKHKRNVAVLGGGVIVG